MAGKVLERKRGAGRPPGPRAPLLSVLHSTVGMLKTNRRYYCSVSSISRYFFMRHVVNELSARMFRGI